MNIRVVLAGFSFFWQLFTPVVDKGCCHLRQPTIQQLEAKMKKMILQLSFCGMLLNGCHVPKDIDEDVINSTSPINADTSTLSLESQGDSNDSTVDSSISTISEGEEARGTSSDTVVFFDSATVFDNVEDTATVGIVYTASEPTFIDSDTGTQESDSDSAPDTGFEKSTDTGPDTATISTDSNGDTAFPPCDARLVINEIDYDIEGADNSEFIELFNPTDCEFSLAAMSIILFNGGTNKEYRRYSLFTSEYKSILPGQYLVLAGPDAVIDEQVGVLRTVTGFIQNGPDGMALFDEETNIIMDSVCWEGVLDNVTINNVEGSFNLVEGTPVTVADVNAGAVSIGRFPDGNDDNDGSTDWQLMIPTPGFSNVAE